MEGLVHLIQDESEGKCIEGTTLFGIGPKVALPLVSCFGLVLSVCGVSFSTTVVSGMCIGYGSNK